MKIEDLIHVWMSAFYGNSGIYIVSADISASLIQGTVDYLFGQAQKNGMLILLQH